MILENILGTLALQTRVWGDNWQFLLISANMCWSGWTDQQKWVSFSFYHLESLSAGCKILDQDEIDDLYDQRVSSVIQGRQPSFVPLPTIVCSDHIIIFKRNIICNIDIGWQSVEWNDISDDDPEYFWYRVETSHWSRSSRYCALIGWYQYHSVTTPAL